MATSSSKVVRTLVPGNPENPEDVRRFMQETSQQLAYAADDIDTAFSSSDVGEEGVAPTNSPAVAGKTNVQQEDGSMDVVLQWTYAQGDVKADFIAVFVKEGATPLSAPAVTDSSQIYHIPGPTAARFEGLNPQNNYRFGIAAGRFTAAGAVVGAIISPTASDPVSWDDVTLGRPYYIGTLAGAVTHSVSSANDTLFHYDTHKLSTQNLRPKQADVSGTITPQGRFHGGCAFDLIRHNYLPNADFSNGTTGWTVAVTGSAAVTTLATDTNTFAAAARLKDTSASDTLLLHQIHNAGADIGGQKVWITFYAKILKKEASNARIIVKFLNCSGSVLSSATMNITTEGGWVRYDHELTCPSTTYRVDVRFESAGAAKTETLITAVMLEINRPYGPYAFCKQEGGTIAQATSGTTLTYDAAKILNPAEGTMNVWCLVRPWHKAAVQNAYIFRALKGGGQYLSLGYLTSDKFNLYAAGNAGTSLDLFSSAVAVGWHMVTVTWKKSTGVVVLYVDGVQAATGTNTAAVWDSVVDLDAGSLVVGTNTDGSGAWGSLLSELTFLKRAADADEVQAWYDRANAFVDTETKTDRDLAEAPTTLPVANGAVIAALDSGNDYITIDWTYTQPVMTETSVPADFFVIAIKKGDSATPGTASDHQITVNIHDRKVSWETGYGQPWSAAVAAGRYTKSGPKLGTFVTSAAGPDWRNIGGVAQIDTPSIANDALESRCYADESVDLGSHVTGTLTVDGDVLIYADNNPGITLEAGGDFTKIAWMNGVSDVGNVGMGAGGGFSGAQIEVNSDSDWIRLGTPGSKAERIGLYFSDALAVPADASGAAVVGNSDAFDGTLAATSASTVTVSTPTGTTSLALPNRRIRLQSSQGIEGYIWCSTTP